MLIWAIGIVRSMMEFADATPQTSVEICEWFYAHRIAGGDLDHLFVDLDTPAGIGFGKTKRPSSAMSDIA